MNIKGDCPTPRKTKFYDKNLAESVMLHMKYNRGYDVEIYACLDHYHIRDREKRREKEKQHEKERLARRKKFKQLTIFDWMNELNGA